MSTPQLAQQQMFVYQQVYDKEREKRAATKNILLISVAVQNKNGDNKTQIMTYKIDVIQNEKAEQGGIRLEETKISQSGCNNAIISLRHSSDRGQP